MLQNDFLETDNSNGVFSSKSSRPEKCKPILENDKITDMVNCSTDGAVCEPYSGSCARNQQIACDKTSRDASSLNTEGSLDDKAISFNHENYPDSANGADPCAPEFTSFRQEGRCYNLPITNSAAGLRSHIPIDRFLNEMFDSITGNDSASSLGSEKLEERFSKPASANYLCSNLIYSSLNEYRYYLQEKLSRFENSKFLPWALQTSLEIQKLLETVHGHQWVIEILHIEHVKSYAPHVDHIVLDLKCIPLKTLCEFR